MQSRATLAERRKIGAYYTPQTVTDALSEWAIQDARDTVLEPGFGGCGFLESSVNRLRVLGCANPSVQIHGCDIDRHAFRVLHARLGLTQVRGHFVLGDFLTLGSEAFGGKQFDVAIGNPPYIRHHHIVGDQKALVRALRDRLLPALNLQASLWAYFVLHACEFLKPGGRAAWILPSSFSHAYYAKSLNDYLHANFAQVKVIALDERLFESEGAAEGTVVVVAEGWRQSSSGRCTEHLRARSVAELRTMLSQEALQPEPQKQTVFDQLCHKAVPLRDFCKLSIGVVTGDADFFLFNRDKADDLGICESNLTPIVSRAKLAAGLSVSTADLKKAFEAGAPSMILDTRARQSVATKRYLKTVSKKRIAANLTFGKRAVWHRPLDNNKSEAFFTCMSHHGPRLVLNESKGATCTNTLYRAAFREGVTKQERKALALALISSFGQLAAERHGRSYGAGMLKHEPSEAEAIRLILPDAAREVIDATFKQVDSLLRDGDDKGARLAADTLLISTGAMSKRQCGSIRAALTRARALRRQRRAPK